LDSRSTTVGKLKGKGNANVCFEIGYMKYQLVIQFPVTEDFDFDAIIALETKLTLDMGEGYIVDGHGFSTGEINIFIQTDNAEAGYRKAFDMVSINLIPTLRVAYRAKDTNEFIWLYPDNNQDIFSIQ
jgi:hypothetical protein